MRLIVILVAVFSVSSVQASYDLPGSVEMSCKGGAGPRFRCTAANVEGMLATWTLFDNGAKHFAPGRSATFASLPNRCAPLELRASDAGSTHVIKFTVCTAQGKTSFFEPEEEPLVTRLLRVAGKVVRSTHGDDQPWQVREDARGWHLVVWTDAVVEVPLDVTHSDKRMSRAIANGLAGRPRTTRPTGE